MSGLAGAGGSISAGCQSETGAAPAPAPPRPAAPRGIFIPRRGRGDVDTSYQIKGNVNPRLPTLGPHQYWHGTVELCDNTRHTPCQDIYCLPPISDTQSANNNTACWLSDSPLTSARGQGWTSLQPLFNTVHAHSARDIDIFVGG